MNFQDQVSPTTSEGKTVLHSWCVQTQWQAPTIVGGRRAHFWDKEGHDYLDMSSLAECCNLGHQHPAVVRAIAQQAERLCFVTSAWGAEPRAELARVLLDKAGQRMASTSQEVKAYRSSHEAGVTLGLGAGRISN